MRRRRLPRRLVPKRLLRARLLPCDWQAAKAGFDAAIDICPSDKPSKRILKHMDTPENQPDFGLATTPFEAPEGWPGYHVLLSK